MNKIEKALETCEKVLDGVEEGTMLTSSALLLCLKIARLLNDQESLIWLQYENNGYPTSIDGYLFDKAWTIANSHGRGYVCDGKPFVYIELAAELEEKINAQQNAINNFSTQGISASGDYAVIAMNSLTNSVISNTNMLIASITQNQKRLSILRSRYYDYALKKHIEISFGNVATDIFSEYRKRVENYFSILSKETILKLQAIEDKINSDNPEMYSQALTTCRRLFESTANELFDKYYPGYADKKYITKSGREIDISGDHYKNKLAAVIEKLEEKSVSKSIVGSNILYLLDWIDNLNKIQCKGVHSDVAKQDAVRCIIQTYICLGDILTLQAE